MLTVKNISQYIDTIAPYETKCQWDNCGILVGDENKEVHKIGVALDLTAETLEDAVREGVELIITHHPVIFKAQKSFLKGNIAFEAASEGISVISAHTCFDCAKDGVNDALCQLLGIKNYRGVECEECSVPMARIGEVSEISSLEFADFVAKKLDTVVRVVNGNNTIKRVAVCGGSGADFLKDAVSMGADAYVTGDMSHHEFLEAAETGITVIAAGHFETENPAMLQLKALILNEFPQIQAVLLKQSNPVIYVG